MSVCVSFLTASVSLLDVFREYLHLFTCDWISYLYGGLSFGKCWRTLLNDAHQRGFTSGDCRLIKEVGRTKSKKRPWIFSQIGPPQLQTAATISQYYSNPVTFIANKITKPMVTLLTITKGSRFFYSSHTQLNRI